MTERQRAADAKECNGIMSGDRFGLLVVVDEAERIGGHRMWRCRCDCGTTVVVRGSDLRRRTRSCGCTGGRPRKDDGHDRGYARFHDLIRRRRGKASVLGCLDCEEAAAHWSYVGRCPEQKVSPDGFGYCEHLHHYQPRCRSCHVRMDHGQHFSVRRIRAALLTSL